MLMPIVFLSLVRHIMQIKWLWKIESLFIFNLSAFVFLSAFKLEKNWYFLLLMIHHVLIYICTIIGMVCCIRKFCSTKDRHTKWILCGLFAFAIFGVAALVVFLLNLPSAYVLLYSIGFFIMIFYMLRLTVSKLLSAYNQSEKTELYRSLAYTDILTELKNRNAFILDQYERLVEESTCCIVMDVNKLKWVNDTLGHNYGDELIRRCAKIIDESFANLGICYRVGGDEFVVVCQNADALLIQKGSRAWKKRSMRPMRILVCKSA